MALVEAGYQVSVIDRGLWIALPREVDARWRERHSMELVNENGKWRIRGAGAERANVAYASFGDGKLIYRIEAGKQSAVPGVACD